MSEAVEERAALTATHSNMALILVTDVPRMSEAVAAVKSVRPTAESSPKALYLHHHKQQNHQYVNAPYHAEGASMDPTVLGLLICCSRMHGSEVFKRSNVRSHLATSTAVETLNMQLAVAKMKLYSEQHGPMELSGDGCTHTQRESCRHTRVSGQQHHHHYHQHHHQQRRNHHRAIHLRQSDVPQLADEHGIDQRQAGVDQHRSQGGEGKVDDRLANIHT